MAFQRPFSVNGVEYPAAYSRIMVVQLSANSGVINVGTYADLESRLREDPIIYHESIVTFPSALVGDTYKLAYAYLQTQPGFENATVYPDGDDVKAPVAPEPVVEETPSPEA